MNPDEARTTHEAGDDGVAVVAAGPSCKSLPLHSMTVSLQCVCLCVDDV